MFVQQNQNKSKIKEEIANLITSLVTELKSLDYEHQKKLNELSIEKNNKRDEIIKKYSLVYSSNFNN